MNIIYTVNFLINNLKKTTINIELKKPTNNKQLKNLIYKQEAIK